MSKQIKSLLILLINRDLIVVFVLKIALIFFLVEETYLYWLSIYYKLINEIYTNKLHYLRRAGAMERIVGQTKLYFMET